MTFAPLLHRRSAAPRGRAAPWTVSRAVVAMLVALVFLAQMLAAMHHDHGVASKSQHCVSCALHAQPHAAPPDAMARIAPFGWLLLHALPALLPADRLIPAPSWLIPLPTAPPSNLQYR